MIDGCLRINKGKSYIWNEQRWSRFWGIPSETWPRASDKEKKFKDQKTPPQERPPIHKLVPSVSKYSLKTQQERLQHSCSSCASYSCSSWSCMTPSFCKVRISFYGSFALPFPFDSVVLLESGRGTRFLEWKIRVRIKEDLGSSLSLEIYITSGGGNTAALSALDRKYDLLPSKKYISSSCILF